jgi:hypothetical protein
MYFCGTVTGRKLLQMVVLSCLNEPQICICLSSQASRQRSQPLLFSTQLWKHSFGRNDARLHTAYGMALYLSFSFVRPFANGALDTHLVFMGRIIYLDCSERFLEMAVPTPAFR